MKWRLLLNEEEIVIYLKSLSFEIIFIEELNVNEQIELFQAAEIIVAPIGSALLNLIFADTSTKLLALSQPNLHNWGSFQGPMDALGYQSICVAGGKALDQSRKHSNYSIPVSSVRAALSYLGIN
jgi:capsular polysaccharide biosynthesis protein